MGLDITAVSRLVPIKKNVDQEFTERMLGEGCWFHIHDSTLTATEEHFPGRTRGLKSGLYGCADRLSFRAGSYSGYGEWRDWLAKLAGWNNAEDCWKRSRPGALFSELINFYDNEGVIGPEVAAKLYEDFIRFTDKVLHPKHIEDDWNRAMFRRWRAAFELAADGGVVMFH